MDGDEIGRLVAYLYLESSTYDNREEKLQAEAAAEIGAAELPCNISADSSANDE
jgi:hypothetical protein